MLPSTAFAPLAKYLQARTVQVSPRNARSSRAQGTGSGVIWSDDTIVTNSHVISNAHTGLTGQVTVTLSDGRCLMGVVALRDPRRDLAAIRLDASPLPHATPADSSTVRAGDLVFAAGNPLGVTGAVTQGVIHAAGTLQFRPGLDWLQADVRLAPGNSGGPLANVHGEVLGINTMIFAGLALAIPSNAVKRFLAGIGTPRLGVTLRPVRTASQGEYQAASLILEIEPASAAAAAGLLQGDVMLKSASELASALEAAATSGQLTLDFLRAGRVYSKVIPIRPIPNQACPETRAA